MPIASVQWQLYDAGNQASWVKQGPSKIYRLGYFSFDYDGFHGKLEYIRFDKQIFFPENRLCTGYHWQLEPGVRGDFFICYTKLNELPVDVITQAISMGAGKVAGLGKITRDGNILGPSEVTKIGQNQRLKGYISN